MKLLSRIIIGVFLFTISLSAEIVIAYDTQDFGDTKAISPNQQIDVDNILKIAKEKNIKVTFKPAPWKRALLMVEKGKVDGVINASFKANRALYANYPMKDGLVDDSKRLNDGNSYYIYRHKDSKLKWDGTSFLNGGVVAAMEKYAVIEDLEKHSNITIKTFRKNADIVRQLASAKLDAYAGSGRLTDRLLNKMPVLAQNIVRDSLPIREKPYFVIFSKITYQDKSKEMELLWDGLKELNQKK